MEILRKCGAACGILALVISGCGKIKSGSSKGDHAASPPPAPTAKASCPADKAQSCTETQAELQKLEDQRSAALAQKDGASVARLSLQINKETELLNLLNNDVQDKAQYDALDSKYQQLSQILEEDLAAHGQPEARTPPETSTPTRPDGQTPGTAPSPRLPNVIYAASELAAVTKVFHDFGDLYVNEGTNEVKLDNMPWAGYWYPFRGTDLFGAEDSPLQKLDRAMLKAGRDGKAADYEKNHDANYPMDTWEGRCFAWAVASASSNEPSGPITYQGETFSVADQKALLVKLSEAYPTELYGVRYDGDERTDGTYQDLRPEAFHRLVLSVIGDQKRPFVIDDDPGIQVWSKPVFRMSWTITKDPSHSDAYIVVANPWLTKNREVINDDPTTIDDRGAPTYKYRLYVDPTQVKDGKFKVIAGEWLEDSIMAHPDTASVLKGDGKHSSNNPEINKNLDLITKMLGIDQ